MTMNEVDRRVRKFVYDSFLENGTAPAVAEIARGLGTPVPTAAAALDRLDRAHQLKLLDGTSRILMAFPFSAISTPFRVTRSNGTRYFANCAWDAIAFHAMLDEPIRIDSFCDRSGAPLRFRLEAGTGVAIDRPVPRVLLSLPAAAWWNDITRTCANTMVFLGAEEFEAASKATPDLTGPGVVTVDQVHKMSVPIYAGRLRLEYERPPTPTIQSTFEKLGLTGPFWSL